DRADGEVDGHDGSILCWAVASCASRLRRRRAISKATLRRSHRVCNRPDADSTVGSVATYEEGPGMLDPGLWEGPKSRARSERRSAKAAKPSAVLAPLRTGVGGCQASANPELRHLHLVDRGGSSRAVGAGEAKLHRPHLASLGQIARVGATSAARREGLQEGNRRTILRDVKGARHIRCAVERCVDTAGKYLVKPAGVVTAEVVYH